MGSGLLRVKACVAPGRETERAPPSVSFHIRDGTPLAATPGMMKHSIVFALAACAACSRTDGTPRTAQNAPTKPAEEHAADSAATHASPLDGTHWRLVEIQSMDDRQGKTRPDDPSKYTLSFEHALVAMRLDCNRASGPFTVNPSGADSGSLTIGPLAVTRAFCKPPSLGDRIGRDMDRVRSYRLVNGRLSLSLMADGGIYLWEPDTAARSPGQP